MRRSVSGAVILLAVVSTRAFPESGSEHQLRLKQTTPIPEVQGRIDHLAIDLRGRRLFVAALGNNSVEVIDISSGSRLHTLQGLAEPQGIAYVPDGNRLFVANAKDGSVRSFDAETWAPMANIPYRDDADNLRVDPSTGHLWVGYGSGALAEFDVAGKKLGEIKLDAHPESFQLERQGRRAFVNLPKSMKVGVLDLQSRKLISSWHTGAALSNYPMALDETGRRLFVVTRMPARLIVFDTARGRRITSLPTIGDCDEVFFDQKRKRIYAIGGEGGISVIQQKSPDDYAEVDRVTTLPGARTGLFSPELDILFVAVRANGSHKAEIRAYSLVSDK